MSTTVSYYINIKTLHLEILRRLTDLKNTFKLLGENINRNKTEDTEIYFFITQNA